MSEEENGLTQEGEGEEVADTVSDSADPGTGMQAGAREVEQKHCKQGHPAKPPPPRKRPPRTGAAVSDGQRRSWTAIFFVFISIIIMILLLWVMSQSKVEIIPPEPLPLPTVTPWNLCRGAWIVINYNCYLYVSRPNTRAGAKDDCKNNNSKLWVPTDKKEYRLVLSTIAYGAVVIDASDERREGSFVNLDTGRLMDFADWIRGEPNNDGNEDCVEIRYSGEGGRWNDMPCFFKRHYICKIHQRMLM